MTSSALAHQCILVTNVMCQIKFGTFSKVENRCVNFFCFKVFKRGLYGLAKYAFLC